VSEDPADDISDASLEGSEFDDIEDAENQQIDPVSLTGAEQCVMFQQIIGRECGAKLPIIDNDFAHAKDGSLDDDTGVGDLKKTNTRRIEAEAAEKACAEAEAKAAGERARAAVEAEAAAKEEVEACVTKEVAERAQAVAEEAERVRLASEAAARAANDEAERKEAEERARMAEDAAAQALKLAEETAARAQKEAEVCGVLFHFHTFHTLPFLLLFSFPSLSNRTQVSVSRCLVRSREQQFTALKPLGGMYRGGISPGC
jgi:hypothetical protein